MDLALWKKIKKERKLTISDISKLADLPKGSVQNIFCGYVPNPRANTIKAIEKALGILPEEIDNLSTDKKEILELMDKLSKEDITKLKAFGQFLIAIKQ